MQHVVLPAWVAGRRPLRTLWRAALLGLLTYALCTYVVRPVRVRGVSMEPTLADRSLHLANLLRHVRKAPDRGDVVLIAMAGRRSYYVKRILALPDETIQLRQGELRVNGEVVPEPYLAERGDWDMPEVVLGPEQYFVAGDNRTMPLADHLAGVVHRDRIAGGLIF